MTRVCIFTMALAAFCCPSKIRAQCHAHHGACDPYHGPSICEVYRAGYDANVYWPKPYVAAARRGICSAFSTMANNGWRRQNLLGDHHFVPESNELNHAGRLKVTWILTQAPVHRREVFVQRGANQSETADRLTAVEDWGSQVDVNLASVPVSETHIVAEGHTAGSVDNVFVGFQNNLPAPVLLPSNGSSGNNSGNQ